MCNYTDRTGGSSGGGGAGGSGGASGPEAPPPPEGLTPDQAVGFVPVGGGPPPAAAPPTTFELAQQAMAGLGLPVPTVGTAPAPKTYVRVKTSLWVEGVDVVKTEEIGAPRLQATAKPESVDWNMGEKTVHCQGLGSKKAPTCTYTYQRASAGQPGGSYKITATITWHVTWNCALPGCAPAQGDLGFQTSASVPTPLVVSEIQTNTRG